MRPFFGKATSGHVLVASALGESFQRFSVRKGLAYFLPKLDVPVMDRVEHDNLHLFDVRVAVFVQELLVYKDVDYFPHKVIPACGFVDFFFDAAFQCHGEIGEDGCVDFFGLDGVPSRPFQFVRVVLCADQAHVVCRHMGACRGESNRELIVGVEVVCRGMRAQGDEYFIRVPLAAPCGVHGVGFAVLVVGADN